MAESAASGIEGVTWRDMKTGYVWYYLPHAVIAGEEMTFGLCFFRGRLWGLSVAVVDDRFGHSWSDWSEAKEQDRTAATRAWLERVGYPPGKYAWGEVWAVFDEKAAAGGGGVRYNNVSDGE